MRVPESALTATVQDTSASPTQTGQGDVAFVPKAGGPPDTSSYMIAGYAVTFVLYGAYILVTLRRLARARRAS